MKNLLAAATVLILLSGCSKPISSVNETLPVSQTPPSRNESPAATGSGNTKPIDERPIDISLTAIGDLLIHGSVYSSYAKGSTYDFNPMFEDIAPFINKADFTIGNLETVFAGKEASYSSYPMFNTPEQLGLAVKNTLGVDLVSTNNNHSLDRSIKGLNKTIDFLDVFGLEHTGTYKTKDDSEKAYVKDIKGAKIAFASFSYGTNGNVIPKGYDYSIDLIDKNKILERLKMVDELNPDFVVVMLHWGIEYQRQPNKEQRELAKWIFENTSANMIIGTHPHVAEPIEILNVKKDGKDKKGIVCYSLGNFTGGQTNEYTDTGIVANFNIKIDKNNKEKSYVEKISYMPTFIDKNPVSSGKNYRVINLNKAIFDYENKNDSLINAQEYSKLKKYREDYHKLIPNSDLIFEDTER